MASDIGNFQSAVAIVNALKSDGIGGAMLSLRNGLSAGSISFVDAALSQLHEPHFFIVYPRRAGGAMPSRWRWATAI
jgi:hypothetical protein